MLDSEKTMMNVIHLLMQRGVSSICVKVHGGKYNSLFVPRLNQQ